MGWKSTIFAAMLVPATIATAAPTAESGAPTTQPSPAEEMENRIIDLQNQVSQLQSRQATSRAAARAAIMKTIIGNPESGPPAPVSPFLTGYDPTVGFVIQSADGNFSMHPGVLLQARYAVDDRNRITPGHGGATGAQGDNVESGFELTRLRFTLDGNVISPLLTYYFQVGQDEQMAGTTLLDAYLMYRVSNQSPLALKLGQYKDPVWHEQNLLPSQLMAVDRSLVNSLVGGGPADRIQGGEIVYDQDNARGEIGLHHGYDGENVQWNGPTGVGAAVGAAAGTAPINWGSSARGEYLVIGDREPEFNPFSEYDQFSARGDSQNILVAGGGVDYSESGANKMIFHSVDAQYNTVSGWMLYGAYLGAYRNYYTNRGVAPGSYYDSGCLVQAAYLLTPKIEPFIRYDYTHLDGRAEPGIVQDTLDEITIGANYYLYGQHAKITIDASWLPNGSPTDVNYLDILQNNGHNEYVVRAQFQIAL